MIFMAVSKSNFRRLIVSRAKQIVVLSLRFLQGLVSACTSVAPALTQRASSIHRPLAGVMAKKMIFACGLQNAVGATCSLEMFLFAILGPFLLEIRGSGSVRRERSR